MRPQRRRLFTKGSPRNLSGRRQRKLVDEEHQARLLVARESLASELDDVGFGERAAGTPYHERGDALAPLLIRHADDCDRVDLVVLLQSGFDLARRDVLTAADDQVALPPGEEEVSA